jgi:hypothetical protein
MISSLPAPTNSATAAIMSIAATQHKPALCKAATSLFDLLQLRGRNARYSAEMGKSMLSSAPHVEAIDLRR